MGQLTVDLHGTKLTFQTPEAAYLERFQNIYGHLPADSRVQPDIEVTWHPHAEPMAPLPPDDFVPLSEEPLITYYERSQANQQILAIRLPKYALILVDLQQRTLTGTITANTLTTYGAFEDVLLISLVPLYRRQGWFALHAFAAQAPNGQGALISGPMGSGKTTTGLALLNAAWKLLSNDSPLLTLKQEQIQVLAYPGQLSAFDDSLARFERLKRFIPTSADTDAKEADQPPEKRVFRAEAVFPEPWVQSAPAGGIFFPQVVPTLSQTELVAVPPKEAVLRLIPQSIEGWDKAVVTQNLHILRQLVEQAPAYILKLAPHVNQIPAVIARGMTANITDT